MERPGLSAWVHWPQPEAVAVAQVEVEVAEEEVEVVVRHPLQRAPP